MRNGYFRLVAVENGFGIEVNGPETAGERIKAAEVIEYLEGYKISFDQEQLKKEIDAQKQRMVIKLGDGVCPSIPETYRLKVSEDGMNAVARFYCASETGSRMKTDDFVKDLRFRGITAGIHMERLQEHFGTQPQYCTELVIAEGTQPVQGTDAYIIYNFDVNPARRPAIRSDGSVDYFHMTTINQCHNGEELARVIPEVQGIPGNDIFGKRIAPRDVKRENLKYGNNIRISEDRRILYSMVDGHVSLVDGKVFVSSVYGLKDVDVSTGNIEFDGDILITGNVMENYEVKSNGNVTVNGQVEGATIIAGGDIVIAKGMNGMSKGRLTAGGNVAVKYLENVIVEAGGCVDAEVILHCQIAASGDVSVEGKKGLIVGGSVRAGGSIYARNIGAAMGTATMLEAGVNPSVKERFAELQKRLVEVEKTCHDAETVILNFSEKLKKGISVNESQLKYIKTVAELTKQKKAEKEELKLQIEQIKLQLTVGRDAQVQVKNEIFQGTTVLIGNASKTLQTGYRYCRFVAERGEVCMTPL